MTIDKAKWACLIAFTVAASGCGKSGDSNDSAGPEVTNPPIVIEDPVEAEETPTVVEVVDTPETSDGIATPVAAVSSAQMDAFVTNPLVADIPEELRGGTSTAVARSYITNPLTN